MGGCVVELYFEGRQKGAALRGLPSTNPEKRISGGGSGPGAWGECSCSCGGMSVGGGDARVRPLLFSLHAHPAGSDLCPSGEILVACASCSVNPD